MYDHEMLKKLSQEKEKWEESVNPQLIEFLSHQSLPG